MVLGNFLKYITLHFTEERLLLLSKENCIFFCQPVLIIMIICTSNWVLNQLYLLFLSLQQKKRQGAYLM